MFLEIDTKYIISVPLSRIGGGKKKKKVMSPQLLIHYFGRPKESIRIDTKFRLPHLGSKFQRQGPFLENTLQPKYQTLQS